MSRRDHLRERRHEPEAVILPEPEPTTQQRGERISAYPVLFPTGPRMLDARSSKPVVVGWMSDASEQVKAAWPI